MPSSRRLQEMEFELSLVGVLEDMYGLKVRAAADPLNRRARGYATLHFDYHYPESSGDEVKIVVSIKGVSGSTFSFSADFGSVHRSARVADDCEDLGLAIHEFLGVDSGLDAYLMEQAYDRRWDD